MAAIKKAKTAEEATQLHEIPNIGKAMVEDFHLLGINRPKDLKGKDPYKLYVSLCDKTKTYHDPCVLDTFLAAVHFMEGKGGGPWWNYTEERKKNFASVESKVKKWKTN